MAGIRYDLFFGLHIAGACIDEEDRIAARKYAESSSVPRGDTDVIYASIVNRTTERAIACEFHPSQPAHEVVTSCRIDVFNQSLLQTDTTQGFIPVGDADVIVSESLATRLLAAFRSGELRGGELHLVSSTCTLKPLYFLTATSSLGRAQLKPMVSNRCSTCGRFPLHCPACTHSERVCSGCGAAASPEGEIWQRDEHGKLVFGLRNWTGDDFLDTFGGIVSGRCIRWLKSRDAWPFIGVPIPINTDGVSEETLNRIALN